MKVLAVIVLVCVGLSECFQNGDVRLYQSDLKGRLEVYFNGDWGSVCYDNEKDQRGMAQVVCRQLGQRNFVTVSKLQDMPGYDDNNTDPVLARVNCRRNNNPSKSERHILRCEFSSSSEDLMCDVNDEVYIECESEVIDPYDTSVNLVNPVMQETSSGYLEVYVNGAWGTVCNMDLDDASAACRQLGYTGAIAVQDTANYTDNPPVINSFTCGAEQDSSEVCLRNCFTYPKKGDEVDCGGDVAFVTCTFDEGRSIDDYGSRASCANAGLSAGAIAGIAIGSVVGVIVIIVLVVVGVFCLLPLLTKSSKKTKYDAI